MWGPFSETFNLFPPPAKNSDSSSITVPPDDAWKIELPGGGFVQRPVTAIRAPTTKNKATREGRDDGFASLQEKQSLMRKLDKVLKEKADKETRAQYLADQGNLLQRQLDELNNVVDFHTKQLAEFRKSMKIQRESIQARCASNKKQIQELKDKFERLTAKDEMLAVDRELAAKSKALQKEIDNGRDKEQELKKRKVEFKKTNELMAIRCETVKMEDEELFREMKAHLKRLVRNGLLTVGGNSNEIVVEVEVHTPPTEFYDTVKRISAEPKKVSLADIKAVQLEAEKIEVLDDQGAIQKVYSKNETVVLAESHHPPRAKSTGPAETASVQSDSCPRKTELTVKNKATELDTKKCEVVVYKQPEAAVQELRNKTANTIVVEADVHQLPMATECAHSAERNRVSVKSRHMREVSLADSRALQTEVKIIEVLDDGGAVYVEEEHCKNGCFGGFKRFFTKKFKSFRGSVKQNKPMESATNVNTSSDKCTSKSKRNKKTENKVVML